MRRSGLEPPTVYVSGRCTNQLCYPRILFNLLLLLLVLLLLLLGGTSPGPLQDWWRAILYCYREMFLPSTSHKGTVCNKHHKIIIILIIIINARLIYIAVVVVVYESAVSSCFNHLPLLLFFLSFFLFCSQFVPFFLQFTQVRWLDLLFYFC